MAIFSAVVLTSGYSDAPPYKCITIGAKETISQVAVPLIALSRSSFRAIAPLHYSPTTCRAPPPLPARHHATAAHATCTHRTTPHRACAAPVSPTLSLLSACLWRTLRHHRCAAGRAAFGKLANRCRKGVLRDARRPFDALVAFGA